MTPHPHDQREASGITPDIAWTTPPVGGTDLGRIAAAWLMLVVGLTLAGAAVVAWWESSRFGVADADVNRWFERRRTETWTSVAEFASAFSDTRTVVVVGVVTLPLFLWLLRRWNDYAFVFGGLVLEVTSFVVVSMLVGRDRPPVEQLDGAPTNSFPSGHIAASVVLYSGLMLVVYAQTRRRGPRVAATVIGVGVPAAVIASRLYLGMHYPTDAIAGVALGVVVLVVMWHVVLIGDVDDDVPDDNVTPQLADVAR